MDPPFAMEEQALDEHTHVVAVEGEVDIAVSPRLRRRLLQLVGSGKTRLVVDLSGASFVDASLIDLLITVHVRLARGGRGRLALVCDRSDVYRIFELTGFDVVLDFHPTRGQALAAVSEPRG